MDSSISLKDQIWFLRVCHHILFSLYCDSLPGNKGDGMNLKLHFHLLLRLRLALRIYARTGRRHCVVLSTGAVTSSSNACQHGKESSLGCRWGMACYWIVDKRLPIDKAKYSRRLIFTTKIWVMTEISCHKKVTAATCKQASTDPPDARRTPFRTFFEQLWPQCIRKCIINKLHTAFGSDA